jgi:CHASE3 domain sensor protein
MRKTVLTILGALLIAGSAVQMATASEHHVRKSYRASIATSQQFRNAYNSIEGRGNGPWNDNLDFDRRNTFN